MNPTHSFNGQHFTLTRTGKVLSITAKQTRNGRWQYRNPDNKVIASGMNPETFVREYWYGTLETA